MINKSLKLKQEQGGGGAGCLELRLGLSSSDNINGGSPSWSLVGKEAQQRRPDDECDLLLLLQSRETSPAAAPPHPPVGWPPVRASRKNLSGVFGNSKKVKPPPPVLVKVNLEGCAVGRKVDLRAHRGYASLSRALQSMFRAFFLLHLHDDDEEEQQEEPAETGKEKEKKKKTHILLYEDDEGDRMLVGDVPWELFVSSVKRLYIAQDTRT